MRIWKLLLGTAVVLAAASLVPLVQDEIGTERAGAATPAAAPPAMPVPVTAVVKRSLPLYLDYPARTESVSNVVLLAKVSGYLQEQPAADGADVKAGDLLYRIDSRDYEATLDQAKAQLERDVASLDYQRSNLDRGSELAKSGFLAKDTFDQRTSAVRQAQATLAMDRAAIRTAEINLAYTEIRAPFAGRLGRNQAPVGTLVSVGGTTLNTLVQLDPIYVTFNPSEGDLAEIQKARAEGAVEADITVPGGPATPHRGKLTFLDNAVDRSTGTITARATIGNGDFSLLPGQYVRIRLHVGEQPDALMVPQTALGSSQLGKYLYVVGAGNTVEQRLVSLGPTDGDLVVIESGVAAGDQVIDGNLQKIGPGMPVQPIPKKAGA
ncbi:efflux RND transporter periplasmic adaptor subunit [Labrys wisconsinensis]|uniref:Multidrug efflux system membrane fusion protein n=1 Tax=Labrys wisconsinensis TaxID=425677 RepID=A0ABU0JB53_9HYPH|nr:efflux RND transporter periplasmic adaptor subunit [Labrys wisconsinensis]MDQ0471503.1 multidrug efflux system membrane fusion protein [Labrys wisconsinensis]